MEHEENNSAYVVNDDSFILDSKSSSSNSSLLEDHEDESECVSRNVDYDKILNLKFKTIDEAQSFYIGYGREEGFDVRKQTCKIEKPKCKSCKTNLRRTRTLKCEECTKLGKDEKLLLVKNCEWVCHREGFRKKSKPGYVRQRKAKPNLRCGCKARLRVAHNKFSGMYHVTRFVAEHNHQLDPNDPTRRMRCNRYLAPSDQASLTLLTEVGMRPSSVLNYLEHLTGGPGNLQFRRKDGYNYLQKQRMEMVRGGDIKTAISLLDGMRSEDEGFMFQYTIGRGGILTKLFWCDGMSRVEFELFGDVLLFDSTYLTNKYKYPLIILSGVNNHGSTCVFGAAILHNETIDSYKWLLKTFCETMKGKYPGVVFTDQDASMRAAILSEFPDSKHRLCSWHMTRNAASRVRHDFASGFSRLLRKACSEEEFEESWATFTEKHEVVDNPWVVEAYEKRRLWGEAFFRGQFTGGMTTTQRCESMNALIKLAIRKRFTITEFLKHYHRTIQKIRNDFFDKQETCEKITPAVRDSPLEKLEKHVAEFCTNKIFFKVQEQILAEQGLVREKMLEICPGKYEFCFENLKKSIGHKYSVTIDENERKYKCECLMLESKGVPCCHIISAFKSLRFDSFPVDSIHPRWSVYAGKKLKILFKKPIPTPNSQRSRFAHINKECLNLCYLASQTESGCLNSVNRVMEIAKEAAKEAEEQIINQRVTGGLMNEGHESTKMPRHLDDEVCDPEDHKINNDVRDPRQGKTKGAVRSKKHRCGICRVPGHKSSTCPRNKARRNRQSEDGYTREKQRTNAQNAPSAEGLHECDTANQQSNLTSSEMNTQCRSQPMSSGFHNYVQYPLQPYVTPVPFNHMQNHVGGMSHTALLNQMNINAFPDARVGGVGVNYVPNVMMSSYPINSCQTAWLPTMPKFG